MPIDNELSNKKINSLFEVAQTTGILNLTGLQFNQIEANEIKQFIAKNKLQTVSLIGVKPESIKEEIEQVCQNNAENIAEIRSTTTQQGDMIKPINEQFRQHAINEQKVSMRFEPSRIGAAFSKGWKSLFQQIAKEIKGDIPKYGGENNFTEISNIKTLNNASINLKYSELKHDVSPLPTQLIDSLSTLQMPDVNLQPGEMLLYHGVGPDIAPLIMNGGFDENRCQKVAGNGYGPLGKGVYFTNELSKAGTFARCGMCQQAGQCDCVDPKTGEQPDRVLLLCKVFVGNPEIILRKGDVRERTEPTAGYDSCISLSNNIDPISGFRSTEVCVPKGAQAIPLFAINFKSQPSLINKSNLEKKFTLCNLTSNKNTKKFAKDIIKDMGAITKAREKGTDFTKIQEKCGSLLEKINGLETSIKKSSPSKQTTMQLQALAQLKTQLDRFKKEDLRPKVRTAPKPNKLSISLRIKSFFTSKEHALKIKLVEEYKAFKKSAEKSPEDFIDKSIQMLNTAISRDCAKGKHILIKQKYPEHRALLTNAMVRLRAELLDLKEKPLSTEAKARKAQEITAQIFDAATVNKEQETKIKAATNYKLLLQLKGFANEINDAVNPRTALNVQSLEPQLSISNPKAILSSFSNSYSATLGSSDQKSSAASEKHSQFSSSASQATLSDISNESWQSVIAEQKSSRIESTKDKFLEQHINEDYQSHVNPRI